MDGMAAFLHYCGEKEELCCTVWEVRYVPASMGGLTTGPQHEELSARTGIFSQTSQAAVSKQCL